MSDAQAFHCPSCNAPLELPDGAETVRCPYCHNTVIVPDELREKPAGLFGSWFPGSESFTVVTNAQTLDLSDIKDELGQIDKIEVIKHVRELTGLGEAVQGPGGGDRARGKPASGIGFTPGLAGIRRAYRRPVGSAQPGAKGQ